MFVVRQDAAEYFEEELQWKLVQEVDLNKKNNFYKIKTRKAENLWTQNTSDK